MAKYVIKHWLWLVSLFLLIIFLVLSVRVFRDVYKKTDKEAKNFVKKSSLGQKNILQFKLKQYIDQLGKLKDFSVESTPNELISFMKYMAISDSTVKFIYHGNEKKHSTYGNDSSYINAIDQYIQIQVKKTVFKDSLRTYLYKKTNLIIALINNDGGKNAFSAIIVDLLKFHQYFIDMNAFITAYHIVVNENNQIIYHPDKKRIGTIYHIPDNLYKNGALQLSNNRITQIGFSDFLGVNVLKMYYELPLGGEKWIAIGNSPSFEINDIINTQQKYFNTLMVVFSIFVLMLSFLGVNSYKREFIKRSKAEQSNFVLQLKAEKEKREAISTKLELLRTGLNSHFLFNSLTVLKATIGQGGVEMARQFVSELASLFRYQLRIEGENTVTLNEELGFTASFVNILNVRFDNAIHLVTDIPPTYLRKEVLPISIQLLVDNCIKHNVVSKTNPLTILIYVENDMLVVENKLKPKYTFVETNNKGLKNLKTRYALITNKYCDFYKGADKYIARIPIL